MSDVAMKNFKSGEKLLIIDGPNKGKFGTYMYHERDSGYLVPWVRIGTGQYDVAKPWNREVVSMKELTDELTNLEERKKVIDARLKMWQDLEKANETNKST